jgi:hypothetical protein
MGSPRRIASVAVALFAVVVAAACKQGPPPPDKVDPVTIDEARALSDAFGKAMLPCDTGKVAALFDGANLVRRALQKSKAPADMRRGIAAAMKDGTAIATMFCQNMNAGEGTYTLLRIQQQDGEPRPLFRLIADDAVNYHELHLGKSRKDQVVRVADIRVYASGDLLSESITQMLDQLAMAAKSGASPMALQRTTDAIKQARADGDAAEVQRLLGELPAELRDSKPMRLVELMAGGELDEATYVGIMERYRRDFPDDPSLDVVAIDYHFLEKDVDETLAALERLDQRVGGDPYLAVMRANTHLIDPTAGHLVEAERWARRAVESEPAMETAWWTLALVLLNRGDHPALAPVVDTLRTKFAAAIDPASMAGNELWTPYFASASYRPPGPASADSR